ncbi:hypothetical protein EVJ50_11675 [Synechococcus sp. RSCCF101]|uniref:hypothetical protein n=1 Tax=Synechococcus sp. RSCCF101 TaxID=2511069 RepID=UPI001247A6A0|nr:hypothetical protein [Synechococcus sp. RSCCF101]QEY32792.1 hypothetical protein EVJ50_11675 [Synechococcus sp. RSCCF101]
MGDATAPPRRQGESLWLPLLVGFSLAMGYGLVARVLQRTTASPRLGVAFPEREIPGTSLDALRMQHASGDSPLAADLGALSLERLQDEEKQRAEQDQQEAEEARRQVAEAPLPNPRQPRPHRRRWSSRPPRSCLRRSPCPTGMENRNPGLRRRMSGLRATRSSPGGQAMRSPLPTLRLRPTRLPPPSPVFRRSPRRHLRHR